MIQSDPNVDAILVNIFGGIMRCDIIASGIVGAAKTVGLTKPLIIRLEGTNVSEGKAIIDAAQSEIHAISGTDLDDAAQKACDIARIKADTCPPPITSARTSNTWLPLYADLSLGWKALADQTNLKVSFEIPL